MLDGSGVQITSLSHIGSWSLNTGMATGNLSAGATALAKALTGSAEEWPHAAAMFVLCLAFAVGAAGGAWLKPRLGGATLLGGVPATAQTAVISEREWARVLARHVANQLQEAVRTVPELGLTQRQIIDLRQAYENTLLTNMGCDVPTDQPPPQ